MAINRELEVTIFIDGIESPVFLESGYIAIRESMDFLVPSATLVFRDFIGSFVTMYPFMQDTKIGVILNDGEVLKTIPFYVFGDVKKQIQESTQETYQFNVDLLSTHSSPLLTHGEYHSKKCKASEYVQYIAEQLGIKADVEDSRDVKFIVNPNWRYAQMLRFLATRSISISGSSGYTYFINTDGVLVFKTIDKLFEEESKEELLLVLDDDLQVNGVVNRDFQIKGNYFSNVILGANQVKMRYYDWTKSMYVQVVNKYDEYIQKRGIKKGVSHEFAEIGQTKYFGELYSGDIDVPIEQNTSIYKKAVLQAEMLQIEVLVPHSLTRKLGDIVDLTVTASQQMEIGDVSMNYSGRYVIKSMMLHGHSDYYQRLVLMRPGVNLDDNRTAYY